MTRIIPLHRDTDQSPFFGTFPGDPELPKVRDYLDIENFLKVLFRMTRPTIQEHIGYILHRYSGGDLSEYIPSIYDQSGILERFLNMPIDQFITKEVKRRTVFICEYEHHSRVAPSHDLSVAKQSDTFCTLSDHNLCCGHPSLWIIPVVAISVAIIQKQKGSMRHFDKGSFEIFVRGIESDISNNIFADHDNFDHPGGDRATARAIQLRLGIELMRQFAYLELMLEGALA